MGVVAEICDYVSVIYAGSIVEYASVKDMYEIPGHPYTKGLFNSIPSLDEDVESLTTIKGNPPDPSALPSGCRFHPRCDKCMEICKHTNPEFQEVSPGHFIACHLFKKGEGESENG